MTTRLITMAYIDMMGMDFIAEVEVEVYSFGERFPVHSASLYPPDGPEWCIDVIALQRDEPGAEFPWWEIDSRSRLFDVLAEHPSINGAAGDAVEREAAERYWSRKRRRAF